MRVEFNLIDQSTGAINSAIKRAEINIEIFQLSTKPTDYPCLESAARCPAHFGFPFTSKIRNLCANPTESCARSDIGQEAIERIADTTSSSGKPLTSLSTGKIGIRAGIAAANIGPIHISFNAEEKPASLYIAPSVPPAVPPEIR